MPKVRLVEGDEENIVGTNDNYIPTGEDGRRTLTMPREINFVNGITYRWLRRDGDVNIYKAV